VLTLAALIGGVVAFALPTRSIEAAPAAPVSISPPVAVAAAAAAAAAPLIISAPTFVPTVPTAVAPPIKKPARALKRRPARVKRNDYCEKRPLECHR
jgi:hypothetical protein